MVAIHLTLPFPPSFAILKHRKDILPDEWGLFMRGAGVVDRSTQAKNPDGDNISEQQVRVGLVGSGRARRCSGNYQLPAY